VTRYHWSVIKQMNAGKHCLMSNGPVCWQASVEAFDTLPSVWSQVAKLSSASHTYRRAPSVQRRGGGRFAGRARTPPHSGDSAASRGSCTFPGHASYPHSNANCYAQHPELNPRGGSSSSASRPAKESSSATAKEKKE
jgi:hypothetical protein